MSGSAPLVMLTTHTPSPYERLTTEQGIAYLAQRGIRTDAWKPENLLPYRGVYVYHIPTGEVVTLEAGLRDGRPAFIFNSQTDFQKCVMDDFFPLLEDDMSWLENNARHVQDFLTKNEFYSIPLYTAIGVRVPFKTLAECEDAYYKTQTYTNNVVGSNAKRNIDYYFALAVAEFLIKKKNYKFFLNKQYNGYNPSYYVELVVENDRRRDIFSATSRALRARDRASFRTFYWYATGIPPVIAID